jgi:hypothetical protein
MGNEKKKTKKLTKPTKKKGSYAKNEKFPALNSKRQVFARREYMDGDYYHLLNDEEKAFMNAFLSETIVTNFNHGGPELYTAVEDKRMFYRENNYRNKDAISYAKSKSMLSNVDDIMKAQDRQTHSTADEVENELIDIITLKNSEDFMKAVREAIRDSDAEE